MVQVRRRLLMEAAQPSHSSRSLACSLTLATSAGCWPRASICTDCSQGRHDGGHRSPGSCRLILLEGLGWVGMEWGSMQRWGAAAALW